MRRIGLVLGFLAVAAPAEAGFWKAVGQTFEATPTVEGIDDLRLTVRIRSEDLDVDVGLSGTIDGQAVQLSVVVPFKVDRFTLDVVQGDLRVQSDGCGLTGRCDRFECQDWRVTWKGRTSTVPKPVLHPARSIPDR